MELSRSWDTPPLTKESIQTTSVTNTFHGNESQVYPRKSSVRLLNRTIDRLHPSSRGLVFVQPLKIGVYKEGVRLLESTLFLQHVNGEFSKKPPRYDDLTPRADFYYQMALSPKMIRMEGYDPVEKGNEILKYHDFIAITERMDESLVALSMILSLHLSDILYLSAKKSKGWDDGAGPKPGFAAS